ncbi:MAG: amino acid permease, partial [Phycisphaerae bacterium]|nr:amino acid permease [Phycisphaerae bacterium]
MSDPPPAQLKRRVGLGGAVLLGLGSMMGTGVFLALGLAAGIVGHAALLAVVLAGLVAWCS